jgi:arsenate reductase (thioredoxin)
MAIAKPLILILCTGNSCRSQMAEAFFREALGEEFEIASAGTQPAGYVHPEAVACLAEIGIDISAHRSKHVSEFLDGSIHGAITVCDHAATDCPAFPGTGWRLHWSFPDPAATCGDQESVRAAFREIRDQIRRTINAYASGYRHGLLNRDRPSVAQSSNC